MNNNQYYSSKYCTNLPIIGLGKQFKDYLDDKFGNILNDDSLSKVDEHLTNVMIGVEGNVTQAIKSSQDIITNNINLSDQHIVSHVEMAKNEILDELCHHECGMSEELSERLCEMETTLYNTIIDSTDTINKTVVDENELSRMKMEKVREDLIASITNSNDLMTAGFVDLNTTVIKNKDEIMEQAIDNKNELLDAIYDGVFVPYDVYGGVIHNDIHPTINTIDEATVLTLNKIYVDKYTPSVIFSLKFKDIAVVGMNDDATGNLFKEAKRQNELNLLFAYPKRYALTTINDMMNVNISNQYDTKEVVINGDIYIVAMQTAKIVNVYDPAWESPADYTLNYLLKMNKQI